MVINSTLIVLVIALLTLIFLLSATIRNKNKNNLYKSFMVLLVMFIIHIFGLILQVLFSKTNIPPIYFEYIAYIGGMNFSTAILIMALTYLKDGKKIKNINLLYIIPVILLLILWTNDLHHLFYKEYSIYLNRSKFGIALDFFTIYSYTLIGAAFLILLRSSIKNSGFISKQTLFIILGLLFPLSANLTGVLNSGVDTTVYATPILFTATSVCFYIAIFKLKALNVIPVAMKTIMDSMTDSFIVISKDGTIADINKTCIDKFAELMELKQNDNLYEKLKGRSTIKLEHVQAFVKEAMEKGGTITKEYHAEKGEYNKYFEVDVQPIKAKSGNEYVATLLLIRDVTQAKRDMEIMTKNENLVILGELAGGVAHDINTPIAAIKNGIMMLKDTVTTDNERMLLTRMDSCADKIINLVNSMRNQIRNIGSDEKAEVSVTQVINDTLMIVHNETMKKGIKINLNIKDEIKVMGNATKLGQVITNLIMNSIQAYEGKQGIIDVDVYKSDKNEAIIIVEDYAGGIPEKIRPHIFKSILTTKGVAGTGFGLYLAYSVIKGAFGGEMYFETETGKGTKFYISIPV